MTRVGSTIWVKDLRTFGVVTNVVGEGADEVYVCQIADRGCAGDWATVPTEQAEEHQESEK